LTLSGDAFTTNPSVYPTYIPTLIANGDTFVTGTIIHIQNTTLNTPLTLPVVANVAEYSINNNGGQTIGSGGALTIASGVTVASSYLTIASGGSISADNVHFSCNFIAQAGSMGSVTNSFFNASTEFDNTGLTLSGDAFTTNPSVYPTYIPTLIANGDTFVTGTIIDIQNTTLNTPLTLPVVANVAEYSINNNGGQTIGSGGALTIASGVTLASSYLTVASGGSISADNVHLSCNFIAQAGSVGSVTNSFFNASTEFDNTGLTLSGDAFTTNPSVYPTYIPTLIANGDTFATGTIIHIQNTTLNTPLTLPVVANVAEYSINNNGGQTIGSGGALTVASGVTLAGSSLTVGSGGEISADGATFGCPLIVDGASTSFIENCDFSGSTVRSQGTGGPISLSNNWWGTTVIATVEGKITDQSDNASLPAVAFLPVLTAKPTLQAVASTISLSASTNSTNAGGAVTFTATIDGSAGAAPSGTVNLIVNGAYLGTASVDGGVASFTATALPSGNDQVAAVYGGDVNYAGSTSSPAAVDVVGSVSTTTLSASTSQIQQGSQVMLTATVSGSAQTPTGTVTFSLDGNTLGTTQVAGNGAAQLSTSTLPLGTDDVIANYSGDTTYSASTSPPVAIDVTATANTSASTINLTSSANPAAVGAPLTLSATVSAASGSGPTPTGTVTFTLGGNALGSAQVQGNGVAQFTTSLLPLGNDSIVASYSGDTTYSTSTSSPVTVTVAAMSAISAPTIAITSSSPSAAFGTAVTLAATVSSASGNGPTPTGTVTFFSGGIDIGTIALNANGQAALVISSLSAGTDAITSSYSGDANYSAVSTSPQAETILAASPALPSIAGTVLPPAIVAGQKFSGKIPVVILDQGAQLRGTFTVNLFVSDSISLDGSQESVAAISKNLSLKANHPSKLTFALKSVPSSLSDGVYYLIVEITDPNGINNISGASHSIQVAAPFVKPTISVGAIAPNYIGLDKSGTILVSVTNAGNIPASGLAITLGVSSDQATQTPGITLAIASSHIKLAPGKTVGLKLHFKLTPALAVSLTNGNYFPFVSAMLGGVAASAIGSTPVIIG
jgi:hypothetical protein